MIDMHTHILPGIDDGSRDMNESLMILRRARDDGIDRIVTTPHVFNISDITYRERIDMAFHQLKEAASKENIKITLIWGAELMIDYRIISEMEMLNYYTINRGRKYVLLDLPMHEIPPYTQSVIYEILQEGITPIIAHPERNAAIIINHEKLEELLMKGAVAQMNSGSILGEYGRKVKKTAGTFLKKGYISLIGSDVHSYDKNKCSMVKAVSMIKKIICDDDVVDRFFDYNAAQVIKGNYILKGNTSVN